MLFPSIFGFQIVRSKDFTELQRASSESLRELQELRICFSSPAKMKELISAMLETSQGRSAIFDAHPRQSLLVASTAIERYIVDTSDRVIGLETYVNKSAYENEKVKKVISFLPNDHSRQTLVDIGANIGTVGIHSVMNGYFKRCIAFEPEPRNFRLLKANVALNGLDGSFDLHNVALAEVAGENLIFELSEDNYGDHRVRVEQSAGHFKEDKRSTIAVPSECLDSFSGGLNSEDTLIWMDTQGFEGRVLSGAKSILTRHIPIVMEFWVYGLKRSNSFDALLDVLEGCSYRVIIDLNKENHSLKFSRESLVQIAEELGPDGDFTDLLIL